MFAFHEVPHLTPQQMILAARYAIRHDAVAGSSDYNIPTDVEETLINLLTALNHHRGHAGPGSSDMWSADSAGSSSDGDIELNLRQLKRILRQCPTPLGASKDNESVGAVITRSILGDFFPPALRSALATMLEEAGAFEGSSAASIL